MYSQSSCDSILEHLKFLINGAGWEATKIYSNFLFKKERFKINFILIFDKSSKITYLKK